MQKKDLDIIAFHWLPMMFLLRFVFSVLAGRNEITGGFGLIPFLLGMLCILPAMVYCMIRVWRRENDPGPRFVWGLVLLAGPIGPPLYYWLRVRTNPDYPIE